LIVAITVDDSEDISRKEQKSICIRYTHLPSLPVHEDGAQLQLKHMIDVDAKSLSEAILSPLAALGLGSCIVVARTAVLRRCNCNERPCKRASSIHQTVA
jgi:hypothetical protein